MKVTIPPVASYRTIESLKTPKWFAITPTAAVTAGGLFTVKAETDRAVSTRAPPHACLLEPAGEELALTEDQTAQIKAVLPAERPALTRLLARLHEARRALRQAIKASKVSEASVRAAAANLARIRQQNRLPRGRV